jgi:hypothetical protein
VWKRAVLLSVVAAVLVAAEGQFADAHGTGDPPRLVAWNRIGDIALGGSKTQVQAEYGTEGHGYHLLQRYGSNIVQGYYRLHGGRVTVTFYGGRVGELDFSTPYYRTTSGFGVGSRIPLGRCYRTATNPCEHRWHGFVWNERIRETPCGCWTKVGLGAQSLPVTGTNFSKPWFFIYTSHGRVTEFYFVLKFVD